MKELAARLAARGARLSWRLISPGDEAAFPDPSEPLTRRLASGAARIAAREALAALGGDAEAPLPRTPGRYPRWPQGFVGALAHDETLAVALVAPASRFDAVGVDVEPVAPLPEDVAEFALLPRESRWAARDPAFSRALFAAKEAVYKAVNPFDGSPLEYEDIAVDLDAGRARLSDGRALALDFARGAHWIVAAWAESATLGRR